MLLGVVGVARRWIQKAIRRPGALLRWFKRNRARLKRKLGYDPITRRGDINNRAKRDVLRLADQGRIRISQRTRKRLQLAVTLDRLRRRR